MSGREKRVKWVKLLDELTIAGHSHETAAELYRDINDHIPLLKQVNHHFGYLMYVFISTAVCGMYLSGHVLSVCLFEQDNSKNFA